MTTYRVFVDGTNDDFDYQFDGEPQINLTFKNNGVVYRVITRAHDEEADRPSLHAQVM